AFDGLPDPHRVFLGGGGLDVLDAVLERLRPDGLVVATFASVDRAAAAAERLGCMTQISVARGEQLPDGGWRLAAENPVFVCGGHAGGGNDLARGVATRLGAQAVVTTATDATGVAALDLLPGFTTRGDVAAVSRAILDGHAPTVVNPLGWPLPASLATSG